MKNPESDFCAVIKDKCRDGSFPFSLKGPFLRIVLVPVKIQKPIFTLFSLAFCFEKIFDQKDQKDHYHHK